MGVCGQRHAPAALPRETELRVDGCGKSRPTGIQSSERPVHSESLYRLNNPGPQFASSNSKMFNQQTLQLLNTNKH